MTLAEIELARSNYGVAKRYALAAREVAQGGSVSANLAEARIWLGRILEAQGDPGAADVEFDAAFALLEPLGVSEWLTQNRSIYAEILEARGDLAGANRQLRKALAAVRPNSVTFEDARTATA
jgi:tetratricopeptide (TPR) repeat protein